MAGVTAVLFDNFGPYHFARATAAARALDVAAIEVAATSAEYEWQRAASSNPVPLHTLFGAAETTRKPFRVAERLWSSLDNINPTTVAVPGWATAMAFAALRWCVARSRPAVVMSESTSWDAPRRPLQEAVKRHIIDLFSAGIVGGKPHAGYLSSLGMPGERIFDGYDVVDNEFFAAKATESRSQAQLVRDEARLPGAYFLASARFIQKKNLPLLLRAYATYRKRSTRLPWSLVLLGDGPLRSDLEALIAELELQGHVRLPGFKQHGDLPAYYALAGCFVHASTTEQWGLVVNEAMASGLPVLVSRRCGCVPDLLADGENGWAFDPDDVDQLAGLMHRVAELPAATRLQMGEASSARIQAFSPTRFAAGLKAAVETAISVGPRRATPLQRILLPALMHLQAR